MYPTVDPGLLVFWCGLWLALAFLLRRGVSEACAWAAVYDWNVKRALLALVEMPSDGQRRQNPHWTGRHTAQPQRADLTAHEGATETWSPKDEDQAAAAAPAEPEETLAEAAEREAAELAAHRAKLDREAEEKAAAEAAAAAAASEPVIDAKLTAIDEELAALMQQHGIRTADLDAAGVDRDAERIVRAVRESRKDDSVAASFAELRRRFFGAEPHTGQYPIVVPAPREEATVR